MKQIENGAAFFFIIAVSILTVISVMGIWDVFSDDVVWKSFWTLGLLAVVSVVIMLSGKFIGNHPDSSLSEERIPSIPNPAFSAIRKITLTILIVAVSLLAILGVLAIWEVIKDGEVVYKSLTSVGTLAFGAFIIVVTSLEREGHKFARGEKSLSGGNGRVFSLILVVLVILLLMNFF